MNLENLKRISNIYRNPDCIVVSDFSRDGNQYVTYSINGGSIRRNGDTSRKDDVSLRLNSAYRPLEEADKWASQFLITKRRSVIYMFGLGNGYFARELVKKLLPDSKLIIIEPSYDIFSHVVEHYENVLKVIFADDRVSLFLGLDIGEKFFYSLERYVHWSNLASQQICMHPNYDLLFKEDLLRFQAMISQNNEKENRNRNTEAFFGKLRVVNTIKNFRYINDSCVLEDISAKLPRDVPAIIVAAGPSLDKNGDMLKMAKGKAFIIGCDTALRYLYKKGVVPDVAITVDAKKPERYFDDAGFEDMPLLTTCMSNYKVLEKGKGRKIWFTGLEFQIQFLKELGKNLSYRTGGGSVATAAFAICSSLGFKRIILVGQDLAYEGEFSHAGGEHNRIRKEEEGITYVKGIDGGRVRTRADWVSFLKWYEKAVESVKGETEVIDATEGGALIEGTRLMTLGEVVGKYCNKRFDFADVLKNTRTIGNKDKVGEYLKRAKRDVEKIIELTKESVGLVEYALNNYFDVDTDDVKVLLNKISTINNEVQKLPVFCLVDEYARNETFAYVEELVNTTEDEERNAKNRLYNTMKIHQEINGAAVQVKGLLEEEL